MVQTRGPQGKEGYVCHGCGTKVRLLKNGRCPVCAITREEAEALREKAHG